MTNKKNVDIPLWKTKISYHDIKNEECITFAENVSFFGVNVSLGMQTNEEGLFSFLFVFLEYSLTCFTHINFILDRIRNIFSWSKNDVAKTWWWISKFQTNNNCWWYWITWMAWKQVCSFLKYQTKCIYIFLLFLNFSWGILFSHPADYTPVCTTELSRAAKLAPEFAKRNTKLIGLSCDTVENHHGWIKVNSFLFLEIINNFIC